MQKLLDYFTGVSVCPERTIGMEVETMFVTDLGLPILTETSQKMLSYLAKRGWKVQARKANLITELQDGTGNRVSYELGRHNIEIATIPTTADKVVGVARSCLDQLYIAGQKFGAQPFFSPILQGDEDLLVIPDERDAIWVKLDGRENLAPLARTSAVQFTFSVQPESAIATLNRFGGRIAEFLASYPQEEVWRRYVQNSLAKYDPLRYGGPLFFENMEAYCEELSRNAVIKGAKLLAFDQVEDLDIPLYLRSIWWYFRLKRYGRTLCVEVRPIARSDDDSLQAQLEMTLESM